jgi:multimeric flavodoxin WrbA
MADLSALMLNCTLKKSPEPSNTQALLDRVADVLHGLDCETESLRVVDHHVPFGVESDLGDDDEWPQILEKILAADILIMGMSIWFGVRNSVCQMVIERLDGTYNMTNDVGQYPMYNKVGGVVVTGNEDGAHSSAETTVFNMTHLGFTMPPNCDTYWVGDAGPGPSFIEAGGDKHPYTLKTAGWMAHNVVHLARILKEHPIPAEGNTVPMAAMHEMMDDMAPGQEKRMIPAVMEGDGGAAPRRWWQRIGR